VKKGMIILVFCFCYATGITQEAQTTEQQIENITEVNESETEDDSYLQSLRHYQRNKLNLNSASETELKEFTFLTSLQIACLESSSASMNYNRYQPGIMN
jgi:hypothetical protein